MRLFVALLFLVMLPVPIIAQQVTSGIQTITVTVYDPVPTSGNEAGYSSGIDYVQFAPTLDTYGPPLPLSGCVENAPCIVGFEWDTRTAPNGPYTVYAKAYDKRGNMTVAMKTFLVQNDTTPPAMTITAPVAGSIVSGKTNIYTTAYDVGTVQQMELWINGKRRAVSNVGILLYSWNTAPDKKFGVASLRVTATDFAGNVSSKTINVAVR